VPQIEYEPVKMILNDIILVEYKDHNSNYDRHVYEVVHCIDDGYVDQENEFLVVEYWYSIEGTDLLIASFLIIDEVALENYSM